MFCGCVCLGALALLLFQIEDLRSQRRGQEAGGRRQAQAQGQTAGGRRQSANNVLSDA